MTYALLKSTGRGKLRLRAAISGFAHSVVSDVGLEATSGASADGRTWRSGLKTDGIVITQRSSPVDVVPRQTGVRLEIVDVDDGYWTSVFAREPSKATWLAANLTTAGSDITVSSESGWTTGTYGYIGLEAFLVGGTSAGHLNPVTRAQFDSTAITYYAESATAETRAIEIVDRPRTLVGRDLLLYAYGEGETGAGTLIFRGIISEDPQLNGSTWTIEADNTVRILGQTLGEGLKEPIPARGIRYQPGAYLHYNLRGYNAASIDAATDFENAAGNIGALTAVHYESQEQFCTALNTELNAAVAGWAQVPTFRCVPDGEGWTVWIQTASTARMVAVEIGSILDGITRNDYLLDEDGNKAGEVSTAAVAASTLYRVPWKNNDYAVVPKPRRVPRGSTGTPVLSGREHAVGPPTADPQWRRVYVGGDVSLTGVTVVYAQWPEWDGEQLNLRNPVVYLDSVDTSSRYIVLTGSVDHCWSGDPPTFKITREIVERGHLGTVVTQLITDALTESSRGTAPFVTGNHIGSFSAAVSAAARGRPLLLRRSYTIGSAVQLKDLIVNEGRLAGLWVGFSSTGTLRPLTFEVPVPTDPDLIDITPLRSPRPTWQRNSLGTISGARLELGYDPQEDRWAGPVYNVRDVTAYSRNPLGAVVDVKPRSTFVDASTAYGWRDSTTFLEAAELMSPLIGAMGHPYHVVRLDIPLTGLDVLLGDGVRYDSPYVPDVTDGTRGVTDAVGLVVGRTIDLRRSRITLELFVWNGNVRGYAPAVGVNEDSSSNVSGNTWDLVCYPWRDPFNDTDWDEGSDTLSDHFQAGDLVEIYRWNDTTVGIVTGTVSSVTDGTNTIRVAFTGAWVPSTFEWVLRFQGGNVATTAHMESYAYWAGSDRIINHNAAGDSPARVFGP